SLGGSAIARGRPAPGGARASALPQEPAARRRFEALKAWRAGVAREHNLPAYVIFHDATLAAIAELAPDSLQQLQGVAGIGSKKLDTYGRAVLQVVRELAGA
ncbi:MAG: hypothetical protein FGM55_09550, partial [Rhodoferax sp.]|nr:hypothetical protein [Rhodoferax sp.]